MTAEEQLEQLHADMVRMLPEIEYDLRRLRDAYGAKMLEYRKVKHGIFGIENEIEKLRSGLNDDYNEERR
jgi:predicted  nucleic acid-binding Zn-ribbon protein